jgi:hypothetical protein
MDDEPVRGYVNAVLYGVQFVRDLDDDLVRRMADSMINQRHFPNPPSGYAAAIRAVLADGRIPAQGLAMSGPHPEGELLDFLRRLDRHLDELRPWPRPAFLKLEVERWGEFAGARAIAYVDESIHDLTGRLNRGFDEVEIDGKRRPVAILELRSGDLVALLGRPGRQQPAFTLLQRDASDPDDVVARFCEYTKVPPERVTRSAG